MTSVYLRSALGRQRPNLEPRDVGEWDLVVMHDPAVIEKQTIAADVFVLRSDPADPVLPFFHHFLHLLRRRLRSRVEIPAEE